MGREAIVHAEIGIEAGEVRALLESAELILRGTIRRRFPKGEMREVRVGGEWLRLRIADEDVALRLGHKVAESWAAAIAKPAPTLRMKLGLADGARAYEVGDFSDEELMEATAGSLTTDAVSADMIIAVVGSAADLARAEEMHAINPSIPLWVVYLKGKDAILRDTAIRTVLRANGLRDSKSCSVSNSLTATRYGKPR